MCTLSIITKYVELTKGFNWVLHNNTSNNLPYHNLNHLLTVLKNVDSAYEYYKNTNLSLTEKDYKELLLAALFHDVNHTGGKDTDDINVGLAIKSLREFWFNFIDEKVDTDIDINEVCSIISTTEYPYTLDSNELTQKQKILRDADLLQSVEPNWIQQVIMGLCQEMNIPVEDMIKGQREFLSSIEFNTAWGMYHKNNNWGGVMDKLNKLEILYKIEL